MELLEGEVLRRRILESYSKRPKGWSFVVSPSRSGFFDAMVSGPEVSWMLKIDSIFKPFPALLGSQTEADSGRPERPFSYGYRELSSEAILHLLKGEGPAQGSGELHGLLSVLKSEPVVPEAGASYAEGPFVLTGRLRSDLSEGQRRLDDRLTLEMRRLLRTRYPAYG